MIIQSTFISKEFIRGTVQANYLYAIPFSTTFSNVIDAVISSHNIGSQQIGIYSGSNGYPDTLILQLTATTSNSIYTTYNVGLTLPRDTYWIVCLSDSSCTMLGNANVVYDMPVIMPVYDTLTNKGGNGWKISYTGTLPTVYPANASIVLPEEFCPFFLISVSDFSAGSAGSGFSGFSGATGTSGFSGVSGFSGIGTSGFSGVSGFSGSTGAVGTSGFSGMSGFSGFSGMSGFSGFSGMSGFSGFSGTNGTSGFSGVDGQSGISGFSGTSGFSGFSGQDGTGTSGFSGVSGVSGFSGTNGTTGISGFSGVSGFSGIDGTNGTSGFSGFSGTTGTSGFSGFSGTSGVINRAQDVLYDYSGTQDLYLAERQAVTDAQDLQWSSTIIEDFPITTVGSDLVINNSGTGSIALRNAATESAKLRVYPVASSLNLSTLPNNSLSYVYVDYNAGSPIISHTTDINNFNCMDKCLIYLVTRYDSTNYAHLYVGKQAVDANRKYRRKLHKREFLERTQGLILSNTNLNLTLTAGDIWFGFEEFDTQAFDTSVADTFTYAYYNGASWVRTTGQTTLNNTQYVSAGALTTLTNNRYKVEYVYMIPNGPDMLYVLYGDAEYIKVSDAEESAPPSSLPPELVGMGLLVGRFIILKDGTSPMAESAFDKFFRPSAVVNHNDTGNLNVGDYQHLTQAEYDDVFVNFYIAVNFEAIETWTYVAPEEFTINSVTDFSIPTISPDTTGYTILVNGGAYTLGTTISLYDIVTVTVTSTGFVKLNCTL